MNSVTTTQIQLAPELYSERSEEIREANETLGLDPQTGMPPTGLIDYYRDLQAELEEAGETRFGKDLAVVLAEGLHETYAIMLQLRYIADQLADTTGNDQNLYDSLTTNLSILIRSMDGARRHVMPETIRKKMSS